jgi:acyl-coenzyme A thioesterase PaaI-like protein
MRSDVTAGTRRAPMTPTRERQAIRDEVLRALAANRAPGFHFPGHFVGVEWRTVDRESADLALPTAPQLVDEQGEVDFAALAVLADVALGTAARLPDLDPGRQATIDLHLQLTGVAPRGEVAAHAKKRGSTHGTRYRYAMTEATIEAEGAVIAHASAKFIRLEPPAGVVLAPLPLSRARSPNAPTIPEERLEPIEREMLRHCDRLLDEANPRDAFVRALWGGVQAPGEKSAARRLAVGPHVANRVGHVHGGVLLAFAAACAQDAAPDGMPLSALSAWYVGPGRESDLVAHSTILHRGKTHAIVRTEVTSDEATVLQVVTQHVLAERCKTGERAPVPVIER